MAPRSPACYIESYNSKNPKPRSRPLGSSILGAFFFFLFRAQSKDRRQNLGCTPRKCGRGIRVWTLRSRGVQCTLCSVLWVFYVSFGSFCGFRYTAWRTMTEFSLFTVGTLGTALASMCLSLFCWVRQSRLHRHRTLEKRLNSAETEILEILDRVDKLTKVAKAKYSRDAARERRSKQGNGIPDPKEDPEGWKREMMKQHVLGKN